MKEGIPISEIQGGVQPKINRQEQTGSVVDAKGDLARRDEMANAKEFDAGSIVATRALKCTNRPRPGACLPPPPCIIPRPKPNFR
jgi:hypothetical protein